MFDAVPFSHDRLSGFAGGFWPSLHQVSSLEWAVVAAYTGIMIVLSVYGLHRYQLICLYYKHRGWATSRPVRRFENLPRVTVQLPIYNEQFVVEQLIESVCRLDYPRDLLEIQVLDDSTDETTAIARAAVAHWASKGLPVEYLHRQQREGYKAGALRVGLLRASGELIAVFDADFSPGRDFLHQTVHYFTDSKVGAVQARWVFRNRDESLLTRIQAMLLDGHFVFEHGARARSGRFFNFNGTAGVLRRAMIEDAGGWQDDTLTEDTDLSYRAQLRGWKFVYLPDVQVPSELPADLASFQVQQARWAKGLTQTARKILPALWRSDLPLAVKIEAGFHLTANLSYPLMTLLSVLLLPAAIVRFESGNTMFLLLDMPLFLGTFSSMSAFYLMARKELCPGDWKNHIQRMPALLAAVIALTLTNTGAVLEGLLGVPSPFERTAKYTSDSRTARLARRKYRRASGWLPLANFLAGSYFSGCCVYLLSRGIWAPLPFVLLFAGGYYFAAVLLLRQSREPQEKRVSKPRGAASETCEPASWPGTGLLPLAMPPEDQNRPAAPWYVEQ